MKQTILIVADPLEDERLYQSAASEKIVASMRKKSARNPLATAVRSHDSPKTGERGEAIADLAIADVL